MTKSKQRSIIALALLRLATSSEESKQALKVRRTLKIEQRDNSKETRNDFEKAQRITVRCTLKSIINYGYSQ